MKRLTVILFVIVIGLALAGPFMRGNQPRKVGDCMPIEFTAASGQNLNFGDGTAVEGLTRITITMWLYEDAHHSPPNALYDRLMELHNAAAQSSNERITIGTSQIADGDLDYFRETDGALGEWRINSNVITVAGWHHIAITHDLSSINNDPLMYVDGTSRTVTEQQTPSGNFLLSGADNLYLGAKAGVTSVDGKVAAFLVWNRVLAPWEIQEAYYGKEAIPWGLARGLVFACVPVGAAGLQAFDGSVLGASNVIKEWINGATATPAGSPIDRGDSWLRFDGMV